MVFASYVISGERFRVQLQEREDGEVGREQRHPLRILKDEK